MKIVRPGLLSRRFLAFAFVAALPVLIATAGEPSVPAEAPATGKEVLVIKDSKDAQTFDAKGQDVTVNGSRNKVTIKGECHALTISGEMNAVSVEAVASIAITGAGNQVGWGKAVAGERPQITDLGKDNVIAHSAAKAE